MLRLFVLLLSVLTTASPLKAADGSSDVVASAARLVGDPARGEDVFNRCRACHTLADWDSKRACTVGPSLQGIFGRKVGSLAKCDYSAALLEADFIWTPERLDQWLQSPAGYLPGNRMAFQSLANAQSRADLISFLQGLQEKTGGGKKAR